MKITIVNSAQLATALAFTAVLVSQAEASKKFVKMIPNGGNVPDAPAIGHPDGTGKSASTNAFGDAFSEAGNKWTKELCEADTDGDGQTNGQELGDPCCEWDMNTNPVVQWTTGVSHPDDASKTSDPSLWANLCGASTTESTTSTGSASTATSSEPEGASNGSGAPSETTGVDETSAHSSATSSENSTGSSSDTEAHDSDDSSHTHSASLSSSNSSNASDTGSMSTSGSSSSGVEVGSPSASDESSKSTIRGTSSANSAASSASTPSTSSSSSATNGASIVNPLFATAAGVLAVTMAFFA